MQKMQASDTVDARQMIFDLQTAHQGLRDFLQAKK
jgi:hypothetical protein